MSARTTKNTRWSGWVEPGATKPLSDDAVVYAKPDPAWVHEMVPLFPVEALMGDLVGEGSRCPHRGPIARGSKFVCMICHQSGMDHDPALRRDPRTDPRPEPKPTAAPLTRESGKERRKRERREAAARSARTQPGRPPR